MLMPIIINLGVNRNVCDNEEAVAPAFWRVVAAAVRSDGRKYSSLCIILYVQPMKLRALSGIAHISNFFFSAGDVLLFRNIVY